VQRLVTGQFADKATRVQSKSRGLVNSPKRLI